MAACTESYLNFIINRPDKESSLVGTFVSEGESKVDDRLKSITEIFTKYSMEDGSAKKVKSTFLGHDIYRLVLYARRPFEDEGELCGLKSELAQLLGVSPTIYRTYFRPEGQESPDDMYTRLQKEVEDINKKVRAEKGIK